jgi:hypothetical protein
LEDGIKNFINKEILQIKAEQELNKSEGEAAVEKEK